MERNLDAAPFVLMVCTATYRRRVLGEEAPGQGTGVRWEGTLIYNRIAYGEPAGARFLPILLLGSEPAHIPDPVRGHNHYRLATFDLTDPGFEALYRHLTNQPATLKSDLGALVILPPKSRPQPSPGPLPPSGGNIVGSAIGTGNTVNARDINVSLNQGAMSPTVGRIADEFRDVLRPLMGDRDQRKARLDWAFAGHHGLIDQISVDGDTSTFLLLLFKKLREYGEIEVGKPAVCVLLESIKDEVGLKDRERIEEILRVYPR